MGRGPGERGGHLWGQLHLLPRGRQQQRRAREEDQEGGDREVPDGRLQRGGHQVSGDQRQGLHAGLRREAGPRRHRGRGQLRLPAGDQVAVSRAALLAARRWPTTSSTRRPSGEKEWSCPRQFSILERGGRFFSACCACCAQVLQLATRALSVPWPGCSLSAARLLWAWECQACRTRCRASWKNKPGR